MAQVAHGLVVEVAHLARVGLAHGAEAARGRRRFELQAVDVHDLVAFQRGHHLGHTAADHFTVVDVLVDDAFGAPVEGVAKLAARVLGQRAHLQLDGTQAVELLGEIRAHDADETRRQAALGAIRPLLVSANFRMWFVVGTSSVRSK